MCVRTYVHTYICAYVHMCVCTYVHSRPTARLLVIKNHLILQLLVLVQDMSQTQQESDRQARLERRRQLDSKRCARETPDERNRRRSLRQERLRDGYDSTFDPAFSSLRCYVHKSPCSYNSLLNTSLHAYTQLQFLTEHKSPCIIIHCFNLLLNTSLPAYTQLQKQTAMWLLYRVLYSLLAAVVSAISLTLPHNAKHFTSIIDVCSETASLHVHSLNSLLNTSLHAYTQLQFLTEHNSPCIYRQLQFLTEHKSPCIYTVSIPY